MSDVMINARAVSVHLDKKSSTWASWSQCVCLAVVMQPPSDFLTWVHAAAVVFICWEVTVVLG